MKTILSLLLITVVLQSCVITGERGNGNIQSKEFDIEDYSGVSLAGSAKMYYQQKADEKPYLRIEIDENLIQYLEPQVNGGHLDLKSIRNINPTKYIIHTNSTTLKAASLSGAGHLSLDSDIETDKLSLKVSGSGKISGRNIECREIESSVSGSGAVKVDSLTANLFRASVSGSGGVIAAAGAIGQSDSKISGSGYVDIYGLRSENAKCRVSGSGKIRLDVSDALDANVSGSGMVLYKEEPRQKEVSVSGSGKVKSE